MTAGHSQDEIVQRAIDNCWQSFYPPKDNKKSNYLQDANLQACKEFIEDDRIR
jgi:hypothetical protein